MAISLKTDLNFGDIFYIKTDPAQLEHVLTGVLFLPGKQIKFILSHQGEEITLWDFEVSPERNEEKYTDFRSQTDEF